MAFHAVTGKVILFGGERSVSARARLGDTWEWDGATWRRLDVSGPPARMDAVMTYDSGRGRIVLFGGSGANGTDLTDTWEFDGQRWSMVDAGAPGPRVHPTIAYDAARRRVTLFGGARDTGWLRDLWEWDGSRWQQRTTSGPPYVANAAFDASRGAVVALTMDGPNGPATGMSVWDGTQWSPLGTSQVPPISPLEPVVEGSASERLITYRSNYRGGTAATWIWNGTTWTSDPSAGPGALLGYAAAFDAARQRMVVFGGLRPGEVPTDALWERTGSQWQQRP